jgi:hypothetical protein
VQAHGFLTELIESRLMVQVDGRCVSLAVHSREDVVETSLAGSGREQRRSSS